MQWVPLISTLSQPTNVKASPCVPWDRTSSGAAFILGCKSLSSFFWAGRTCDNCGRTGPICKNKCLQLYNMESFALQKAVKQGCKYSAAMDALAHSE
eukprot:scaffold281827_cov18-Tisochrysis_lutea.AAC.1